MKCRSCEDGTARRNYCGSTGAGTARNASLKLPLSGRQRGPPGTDGHRPAHGLIRSNLFKPLPPPSPSTAPLTPTAPAVTTAVATALPTTLVPPPPSMSPSSPPSLPPPPSPRPLSPPLSSPLHRLRLHRPRHRLSRRPQNPRATQTQCTCSTSISCARSRA